VPPSSPHSPIAIASRAASTSRAVRSPASSSERAAHAGSGVPARELAELAPRPRSDRRHQHAGDAGRRGARDHRLAIRVERGDVEVAMRIDHFAGSRAANVTRSVTARS
jgi:hypothetical protein